MLSIWCRIMYCWR